MYLYPNIKEIKKKRNQLNLSQYQLSLKAGIAGNAIYRIEAQKITKVHSLRAAEIAKALNCKVSDIFKEVKQNG